MAGHVLLVLTAVPALLVVMAAVWPWNPYLVGLLALGSAQVALLLSSPVRRHLRGGQPRRAT